jgi:outer membrane protein assembly factor BamD (BamD/ComL family)
LKKFGEALEAIRPFLKEHTRSAPAETVEELRFWQGVCEAQEKDHVAATAALAAFARDYPRSARRPEALILTGSLLVLQGKHKEAVAHFAATRPQLSGGDRGRAVLLELYAALQSGTSDAALRLVMTEYGRAGEMAQLVAFHTLILELGSRYLEAGEHRKALACLQRVWTRERLLKHQRERLAALQTSLDRAVQSRAAPHVLMQQRQMIGQIENELKTFEALPQFDSALRFRIASAFLGMQRYREAALIMEAMLAEMPADSVVEQASVNLIQCWMQIERWPKAVDAAAAFQEKFPKAKELPLVILMQGQAQQSDALYADAIKSFDLLLNRWEKHDLAPRALFLNGFSQLLAEDYAAGLTTLESFAKRYPADELAETAFYWRGMALSMAKEFAKARAVFSEYLAAHADGKFVADATYRRAYCAHSLQEYDTSIAELRQLLERAPETEYRSEALVLLGDGLMALGAIDDGIAAYSQIPASDTKFFEEGWFKTGKALRLQEKPDALREHMAKFCAEHPKSPRMVEALYWVAGCIASRVSRERRSRFTGRRFRSSATTRDPGRRRPFSRHSPMCILKRTR